MTLRELSQTTEVQVPIGSGRVANPNPGDILGDLVVEKTMRHLVEAAGRLVVNKSVPGSGLIASYGTVADIGRVELFSEVSKKTGAATLIEVKKNLH